MLDISPILLLVTGFVFFILLILLNKILYRPLLEFIDNRNNSIKRDLENAGKNTSDVEAYYKEANQIIFDAKTQAAKMREAALGEAKEVAAKRVEQKQSELEEEYALFLKDLEVDRVEFQASLSQSVPLFRDSLKQKLGNI